MDDQKDKRLSDFVEKVMKAGDLESPSADFTANIMRSIEAIETTESLVYRPLIPKKILFLFGVVFVGLLAYVISIADFSNGGLFAKLDFTGFLSNVKFPTYNLSFSKTAVYGVVLLGAMILIQTSLLKRYFDNRLA